MRYSLIVPPDLRRDIVRQPLETQRTLFDLLQHVRDDPDGRTVPHGLDVPNSPVRMRNAAREYVIATVLVNDHTVTVTLIRYAAV